MSNAILIKWTDDGKHKNKCDLVERRFILEDGELSIGQQVRAQFTKKRNSRAKIWGGVVVQRSAQEKKGKRTLKTSKKQPKDTESNVDEEFILGVASPAPVNSSQSPSICSSIDLFSPTQDPITQSCNIATQTDEHSTSKSIGTQTDFTHHTDNDNLAEELAEIKRELKKIVAQMQIGRHENELTTDPAEPAQCYENEPTTQHISMGEKSPPPLPSPIRCALSSTPSVTFQSFNDSSAQEKENIPPYSIDPLLIKKCRVGCRSRKNLAGRLALVLFTAEERKSSNCCGVRGKK